VEDLGSPSSYLVLKPGQSVHSSDGEKVGTVEHVLADFADDIFDGIVLDTSVLPGGHRFVDADQVDEIFERGVLLKIDRAAADQLPEPSKSASAIEAGPDEVAEGGQSKLEQKLSRAWELLSGKEYPPK
jgi:uncharacterized protein YrrD